MFLKRHRFWLLALVLALAAVPIYRLAFRKTNTARCKYDQITGQMTVEDVKALLGEPSWDLGNSYGWTDDSWADEEGSYMIQVLNVEFSNSVALKRLYRLDQMTEDNVIDNVIIEEVDYTTNQKTTWQKLVDKLHAFSGL